MCGGGLALPICWSLLELVNGEVISSHIYWACDSLSILWLKLIRVNKMDPFSIASHKGEYLCPNHIQTLSITQKWAHCATRRDVVFCADLHVISKLWNVKVAIVAITYPCLN